MPENKEKGVNTDTKNAEEVVKALRDACTDDAYAPPMISNAALTAVADMVDGFQKCYWDVVEIRDRYAESARVIHVWLKDFCDDSLPYPEMIADAARKANKALESQQSRIASLTQRAEAAERRAQDARNELCLKCGRYREAHNGACDGCRWREI